MEYWFGLDPSGYTLAIDLLVRAIGLLYIIVYIPFLYDIRGLIGKDGILPLSEYLPIIKERLGNKRFYYLPTLFWINSSDRALLGIVWFGMLLGFLLMLGICPPLILFMLYLVHLSLTSAGQDFMHFGWETFLMEITQGAFLIVATLPYNTIGWIGLNFLLFRFHFQAGYSKILSQDPNWKNLTAISYHYLTQPLPNTISWYFHKLPLWFHKLSVGIMFYGEMLIPFAIFSPPEVRLFVFTQLVGLQLTIWFTGNLSYLNHMTIICCIILVHNKFLEPFLGAAAPMGDPSPWLWQGFITVLASGWLALEVINFVHMIFPRHIFNRILSFFYPLHMAYPHGIFAVMTTKRYEIIIEGSNDGQNWREYQFFYKPGDIAWRPRRISPYQPRLDWQAWFLPFRSFNTQLWFQQFLTKLLQGSYRVTKLLKYNPFPDSPPRFIRALVYDYEFTTSKEREETGHWWKRRLLGSFSPTMRLATDEDKHPDEKKNSNS
jgi:hypothetical protein